MNSYSLKQVLMKTTKILAGKSIEVFMEGFSPRVEFDRKTKKPVRIFIPSLPENATQSLVDAINGFIDHECSHIMFSDIEDICDDSKSKLWHFIHNCIDDPHVNNKMMKHYIGSARNIRSAYKYLFEKHKPDEGAPDYYSKDYVDSINLSDSEEVSKHHLVYAPLWFSSMMGDDICSDKFDSLGLGRLFDPLAAKIPNEWIDKLSNVTTADEVRDLSDYYEKFFKKEALDKLQHKVRGGGKEGEEGESEGSDVESYMETLEGQLAKAIRKDIEYGIVESSQGYYWTDRFDKKLSKEQISKDTTQSLYYTGISVAVFEDEVKSVTNYISKDLRSFLEERRRRYYVGGYRSGKLNNKALFSVRFGNDRVFKKRNEIKDINAAVSLLIDLSGSMSGGRVEVAMQSAYAFSMVLETLKVPYEVYGFTTANNSVEMEMEWQEYAKTASPEILEKVVNQSAPDLILAFKEFDESFDVVSKEAMVRSATSQVGMMHNEDSKHVKMALERLSTRPERIKSLFVFSDGQPAFITDSTENCQSNLKYYGHHAKEDYGVDVYAIGIQSTSVEKFYKNHAVVYDLDELPTALFKFLRKAI